MMQCSGCGEEMVMVSMAVHQHTHHSKAAVGRKQWLTTAPGRDSQTYKMYFPITGGDEEMSSRGESGTGGDAGRDEGTLPIPAYQGHRDHTG